MSLNHCHTSQSGYKGLLVSIACSLQSLTNEEFEGIAYLCSDYLSDDEQDELTEGTKLKFLRVLERKGAFSENGLDFLKTLLIHVRRYDLVKEIETFQNGGRTANDQDNENESESTHVVTNDVELQEVIGENGENHSRADTGISAGFEQNQEIPPQGSPHGRDLTANAFREFQENAIQQHQQQEQQQLQVPPRRGYGEDLTANAFREFQENAIQQHQQQEEQQLQVPPRRGYGREMYLRAGFRTAAGAIVVGGTYQAFTRHGDNPETAIKLIGTALSAGYFLKNLFDGSIILVIEVANLDVHDELWNRYQSGALAKDLEPVLLIDEIKELANGGDVEIKLEMSPENYQNVRQYLIDVMEKGTEDENSASVMKLSDYSSLSMNEDTNTSRPKMMEDEESKKNAYYVLGKHCMSTEQYEDAISLLQKCINVAKACSDNQFEMEALLVLGKAYFLNSRHENAILSTQNCIDIAMQKGDKAAQAHAYNLMGSIYCSLGNHKEAEKYTAISLDIAQQCGFEDVQANAWFILSSVYYFLERYDDAISYGQKCIKSARKTGDKLREGRAYLQLGRTYYEMKQYDDVINHIEISLEIAKEGDKQAETDCYLMMILVHKALKNHADVINYSKKCVAIAKETGNKTAEMEAYLAIGKMYQLLEEETHALLYCVKCSTVAQSIDNKPVKMQIYLALAKLYLSMKQHQDAIYYSGMAMELAKQSFERDETANQVAEMESSFLLSQTLTTLKQNDDAVVYARRCLEIAQETANQETVMKYSIESYLKLLADALIQDALLQFEQFCGPVLMNRLMHKYQMKHEDITKPILQYEAVESLVSNNKYSVIFYVYSDNKISSFFFEYKKAYQFFSQSCCKDCFSFLIERCYLEIELEKDVECESRSLDSLVEPLSDEPLRSGHNYFHIEQWLNSIHTDHEQPNGQPLEDKDQSVTRSALEELHYKLLGGLEIEADEIVIIPDGPLFKVPFAALLDPVKRSFLCETKRIRYAPSLTTLKLLEEQPNRPYNGALVIGNPEVGKVMFNGKEMDILGLPNADCEAQVAAHHLGAECLSGADATKATVLDKLNKGVSLIHIAAHCFLEKSNIALAPSPEVSARRIPEESDYMLTMAEVQNCHINVQLVVLSCCYNGRGQINAEGVMGMCRAFLASGARAVIASLWAIDDEFTYDFMDKFYAYLMRGHSSGESLQMTMKDSRKSAKYSHPKYWAPFFLIGDDVKINK